MPIFGTFKAVLKKIKPLSLPTYSLAPLIMDAVSKKLVLFTKLNKFVFIDSYNVIELVNIYPNYSKL